jgi:hypothetical protein
MPFEIYTTRIGSVESRPLGIAGSILAISSGGEMLFFLRGAILARAPLAGGAPRELVQGVHFADWAPNGQSVAIIRRVEGKFRLEYPIGTVMYESVNRLDNLHISPDGTRFCFREVLGQSIHFAGSDVVIVNAKTRDRRSTGIDSTEFGWGREEWSSGFSSTVAS